MSSLEEVIGYKFRDKELLAEALTHKSHATEKGSPRHNERLEFLGDSVVGLVVSYYLFLKNPAENEGFLSKTKSAIVSRANLARWAEAIGLGHHLNLGAGEHLSGGAKRHSILANAMEALLGAVYLDGGLPHIEKLVIPWLEAQAPEELDIDYKSALQEAIQKRHKRPPDYELLSEAGPEHNKLFTLRVYLGKKTLGLGSGKNKKEAQQAAARNALDYLRTHEVRPGEL
ncbi:MAG: ribonuclease III [Elusimicrobia bacterium GWA2_61_42]|nr:MAG: ribonuclease III [Elusimicrobia bacterium GWA2_61_42]OGR74215.1 MAG: ribonuclease III [Elusimicrobia bacterium GWC2_61_25]